MPGKYLEYIKAGRYVVPVELSFLPCKIDELGASGGGHDLAMTSKWVERRHWKEIKTMLKPAVELVGKYNESVTDKISKSHHVAFGQEIAFGYVILLNKDKCPFVAVLDAKRNCWTDDEETDENSGISDFGGRHKNYTPTKCYIKAIVAKSSGSEVEDRKKIRKELGVKTDDVRNFFQSSSSTSGSTVPSVINQPFPLMTTLEKPHKQRVGSNKKKERPKKKMERQERSITKTIHHQIRDYSSSEESLIDLPPPGHPTSWPGGVGTRTPVLFGNTNRLNQPVATRQRSPGEDDYDSESDTLHIDESIDIDDNEVISGKGGILSDSVDDVFSSSSLFRNWIEDDDDDFDEELPDIEEISLHTSRKVKRSAGSRKKYPGDKSPAKNTLASGLPDIDESSKRGRSKKKRNVAIVEPMKPMKTTSSGQMSFEEAVGAMSVPALSLNERKKRVRSTASPTIDRLLGSRSKNANSAIEILGEDSELHTSDAKSQGSAEKRKRKDVTPRKRRRTKRVGSSFNDRLTPSPFPESPVESPAGVDDDNFTSQESNSESEPEMPVLMKMVMSSDDDQNSAITPPESPNTVPPLEPETLILTNALSHRTEVLEQVRRSPSPDIADHCVHSIPKIHRSTPENSNPIIGDHSQSVLHFQQFSAIGKRFRYASDSDDITSESAYRKTPLLRRKRRKKLIPERSSNPFSSTDTSDQFTHSHSPLLRGIILSPRKQTDDAQTQTNVAMIGPASALFSDISEDEDRVTLSVPIKTAIHAVKTERYEHSQCDESDNAAESISDEGDEDEVLFAGQYQAIPVLTIDSPRRNADLEDDEDEELFSFDRPASVKIESQSINLVETNISINSLPVPAEEVTVETTEEDFEYSFDFVARARSSHTISKTGAPLGSATILNALSDKPADVQILEPHHEHDDLENENLQRAEDLSTFQLMNHPGTLRAGFGFLNKVMSNNGNSDDIYKQFGLDKREKKKTNDHNKQKDSDLMPPPRSKRPISPDICSLNPEQQLRKGKALKHKNRENERRSGSPIPGPSSGIRASQSSSRAYEDSDDDGDAYDHYPKGAEPYFREFLSRTQQPEKEYEPQGDEYDLTQASQCMITVVQDYAEKSRTYKKHTKNIEEMTSDQFKLYFATIKPQILGIFEGTEGSTRNRLYCNKSHQDIRTLKSLNVIRPFHEEHGNTLNSWLYDLLLPYSGSTLKCADYINYVMRPEAFIRIFACVNNVSRETAEKEMLAGPCYEGPYEGPPYADIS